MPMVKEDLIKSARSFLDPRLFPYTVRAAGAPVYPDSTYRCDPGSLLLTLKK